MEKVTLNTRDQLRLSVTHEAESGAICGKEAAALLGLSVRQVRRILAAYRREGVASVPHGNRGRRPPHALAPEVPSRVLALARERYPAANHCHLRDVLEEREGITMSRSTVRRILLKAGLSSPRHRRTAEHRLRRERLPREGMLLQTDASRHAWLEGRGPELTLLAVIDDATGTVPAAIFWEREDHWGYLHLLRGVAERRGLPLALYADRHSVFWPGNHDAEALEVRSETQVGRVLRELGIRLIYAHSPEAKGRIERWWGMCQDRLVRELAWAGATTREEANEVLGRFVAEHNHHFGQAATETGTAYRPWPANLDPDRVFCLKEERVGRRDNTVLWHGEVWQLYPPRGHPGYARRKIDVLEGRDGTLTMVHQGVVVTAARVAKVAKNRVA